ncbi:hypothetical protein VTK56DRAFT_9426 [Thermocarpiscus australiensis]
MDPSQHRGSPRLPHQHAADHGSSDNDQNHQRVRFAEEAPAPSDEIHRPTPRREKPPDAEPSSPTPAVYWDDRDNDANLEEYTFYREGTPTPPEYESQEKGLGHARLATPIAGSSATGVGSDRAFNLRPFSRDDTGKGSLADSRDMSPATKKRVFWIVIAIGALVLIGIAVGLGVGLGVGRSKESADGPAEVGSSPLPASVLSPSSKPTRPTSTSPSTRTAAASETTATSRPKYNSDCPALNNTIYHVPGSTKSFLRLCGIDYSGSGEATDLAEVYTGSMADCMDICASFDQCTACGWGYLAGDEGSEHRCYMKTNLKRAHTAASDWCFAILQ